MSHDKVYKTLKTYKSKFSLNKRKRDKKTGGLSGEYDMPVTPDTHKGRSIVQEGPRAPHVITKMKSSLKNLFCSPARFKKKRSVALTMKHFAINVGRTT